MANGEKKFQGGSRGRKGVGEGENDSGKDKQGHKIYETKVLIYILPSKQKKRKFFLALRSPCKKVLTGDFQNFLSSAFSEFFIFYSFAFKSSSFFSRIFLKITNYKFLHLAVIFLSASEFSLNYPRMFSLVSLNIRKIPRILLLTVA